MSTQKHNKNDSKSHSQIIIRCTPEQLAIFDQATEAAGATTRNGWMRQELLKIARKLIAQAKEGK